MRNFNKIVGSEIVIDTGIAIDRYFDSTKRIILEKLIFSNDFINNIYVTPLTLLEIYYLIYRSKSKQEAKLFLAKLKKIVHIKPLDSYLEIAGEIKALNSISLVDCTNIALANFKGIKVIFKHEKELDKQLKNLHNEKLLSNIIFIDDFEYYKKADTKA